MRRASSLLVLLVAVVVVAAPPRASAAVTCPNANPVVDENACHAGTPGWRVDSYNPNIGGFATQTSSDLGQSVTLKIGINGFPGTTANIAIYRMGYYGGAGARLVNAANGVTIGNAFTCNPIDPVTGKVDCGNWQPTYTVPGSAFPASGVYLAKVTASTGEQTHIVFVVRDDARLPQADMLLVLPMADYEAYNTFGGKSLYYGTDGIETVSGSQRAVKVSFNRPLSTAGREKDWFFGPDQNTVYWLEEQGYDVSYSDNVAVHRDPQSLLSHNAVIVPGHSEYWSREEYEGLKSARDAGVSVASFSANTSYWKVRYEDGDRTLVCYKTVEGGGSNGSGSISANDWGPDGIQGTVDDALGADGKAGTADDHPENSTTTWRDNGAPPGDPNAPPGGRVGPNEPENSLWAVMYVGDNDSFNYPLTVPAANGDEEFAGDRVWRNTGMPTGSTSALGTEVVGWEWDAVPTQPQYLAFQPDDVVRLSATNVQVRSDNSWLQDEGRARTTNPPPGQPGTVNAVKYVAPSGALVFAGGTNQWALGLADDADPRIQQATYNVFSDMGIQPETPAGVVVDPGGSNRVPVARFTASANPATAGAPVTFDGGASSDVNGSIFKYEWDLDGDGVFETNTGGSPIATRAYGAPGIYTVRLRVTDNGGATDRQSKTLTVVGGGAPPAGGGAGGGGGTPPAGGKSGAGGGSDAGGSGAAKVSLAALRKSLAGQVSKDLTSLARLGRAGLLRGGLTVKRYKALAAGRVTATLLARQVKGSKLVPPRGSDPVVLAAGARRFARAGTASIPLTLTKAGKRLLLDPSRLRLTLRLTFADASGSGRATSPRGTTLSVP